MSSSRGGGPPPNRNPDWDYNRQRRRNYYSGPPRRGGGPGSSSLSHSKVPYNESTSTGHISGSGKHRYPSNNSVPNTSTRGYGGFSRDYRDSYSLYGSTKGYGYKPTGSTYYKNYGNYGSYSGKRDTGSNFYNSRSDNYRHDRYYNKPSFSSSSAYVRRAPSNSSGRDRPFHTSQSGGDYGRWRPYGHNRPTSNKAFFEYSRQSSPKDKLSRGDSAESSEKYNESYSLSTTNFGSSELDDRSHDYNLPKRDEASRLFKITSEWEQRSESPLNENEEFHENNREYLPEEVSFRSANEGDQEDKKTPFENETQDVLAGISKKDNNDTSLEEGHDLEEDRYTMNEEAKEHDVTVNNNANNIAEDFEEKPTEKKEKEAEGSKKAIEASMTGEICYPEGCIYPKNKLEHEFDELTKEIHLERSPDGSSGALKYLNLNADSKRDSFSFSSLCLDVPKLLKVCEFMIESISTIKKKKLSLWKDYTTLSKESDVRRTKMDQQLSLIHPPGDEIKREIEAIDVRSRAYSNGGSEGAIDKLHFPSGRRGRRHGDLVTTEAEFQEILQQLEKEQQADPMVKAQSVAAKIPDLILDSTERQMTFYMDSNNSVLDKYAWSQRVKSNCSDNFTPEEQELFCEGFCLYPKKFGAISRHLGGLRTAEECVIHYYATKKKFNYKQMVLNYRKQLTRKNGRRGKKPRSMIQEEVFGIENGVEVAKELSPDENLERGVSLGTSVSEDLYTETGRPKRAVAPTFENMSSVKTKVEETVVEDRGFKQKKRKLQKDDETSADREGASKGASLSLVLDEGNKTRANNASEEDEGHKREQQKSMTSYWNVTETNMFPVLLQQYGTQWNLISEKLNTKSPTMVRNYYQRNAEKLGWVETYGKGNTDGDNNAKDNIHIQATLKASPSSDPKEDCSMPPSSSVVSHELSVLPVPNADSFQDKREDIKAAFSNDGQLENKDVNINNAIGVSAASARYQNDLQVNDAQNLLLQFSIVNLLNSNADNLNSSGS